MQQSNFLNKNNSYVFKFFASLMIMLHHCFNLPFIIAPMWVGIFFFYFGYGLFLHPFDKQNVINILKKKCVSILLPLFAIEIIYTLIFYFLYKNSFVLSEFILNILCIKLLNGPLWYLLETFLIYILYFLAVRLGINSNRIYWYSLFLIFILASVFLDIGTWWYLSTIGFILGMEVSRNNNILRFFCEKKMGIFVVSLLFIVFYIIDCCTGYGLISFSFIKNTYLKTFFDFCLTPFLILFCLIIFKRIKIKRNFKILGTASVFVYLFHSLLILIFGFIENKFILSLIVIVVTISISILIARILTRSTQNVQEKVKF